MADFPNALIEDAEVVTITVHEARAINITADGFEATADIVECALDEAQARAFGDETHRTLLIIEIIK